MNASAQLELGLPTSAPQSGQFWLENANPIKAALLRHSRDELPYNPRDLRKRLKQHLNANEWTGFIGLSEEMGYSVDAVSRVLKLLERLGSIEKTPLYFHIGTVLIKPDRTIHPGHEQNQYQGFEYGYRLKAKPVNFPFSQPH